MNEITIPITPEFRTICKEIIDENLSEAEWSEVESDDMFQTNLFEGGFDTTENAFTFSYFTDGKEYWFQLTLEDAIKINDGFEVALNGNLSKA